MRSKTTLNQLYLRFCHITVHITVILQTKLHYKETLSKGLIPWSECSKTFNGILLYNKKISTLCRLPFYEA